jgi:hypothetical protein
MNLMRGIAPNPAASTRSKSDLEIFSPNELIELYTDVINGVLQRNERVLAPYRKYAFCSNADNLSRTPIFIASGHFRSPSHKWSAEPNGNF